MKKMIDSDLVRRKLARLNMYLEKLMPIALKEYKEYIKQVDEFLEKI